jgi:hypothetical protein
MIRLNLIKNKIEEEAGVRCSIFKQNVSECFRSKIDCIEIYGEVRVCELSTTDYKLPISYPMHGGKGRVLWCLDYSSFPLKNKIENFCSLGKQYCTYRDRPRDYLNLSYWEDITKKASKVSFWKQLMIYLRRFI